MVAWLVAVRGASAFAPDFAPDLELVVGDTVDGQPVAYAVTGAPDGAVVDLYRGHLAAPRCWTAWGGACSLIDDEVPVGSAVVVGGVATGTAELPVSLVRNDWVALQAFVHDGADTLVSRPWLQRIVGPNPRGAYHLDPFDPEAWTGKRLWPIHADGLTTYDPSWTVADWRDDRYVLGVGAGWRIDVTVTREEGHGALDPVLRDPDGRSVEPTYDGVTNTWSFASESLVDGDWRLEIAGVYWPVAYTLDFRTTPPDGVDCPSGDYTAFDACENGLDEDCDGLDTSCHPALGGPLPIAEVATIWWQGEGRDGQLGFRGVSGGDLDGDGDDELLVSEAIAPGNTGGKLLVLDGDSAGIRNASTSTGGYRAREPYETVVGATSVPDVDGDGSREVAFTVPGDDVGDGAGEIGTAFLFRGLTVGMRFDDTADAALRPAPGGRIIEGIAGSADTTGDGLPDLVVLDGIGAAVVDGTVLGPVALGGAPLRFDHPLGYSAMLHTTDLDGDGLDELVIGNPPEANFAGRAWIVAGGTSAGTYDLELDAETRIAGGPGKRLGGILTSGDLDGDGLPELGIASERDGTDEAWIYTSPLGGDLGTGDASVRLTGGPGDSSFTLAFPGDLDGDGASELLVGSPNVGGGNGTAYLLRGPLAGTIDVSEARDRFTTDGYGRFGQEVVSADLDGDGVGDLVLTSPYDEVDETPQWAGAVWVVFGGGI